MTKKAYVKPEIESISLMATEVCNCGPDGTCAGSIPDPNTCKAAAPTMKCKCGCEGS